MIKIKIISILLILSLLLAACQTGGDTSSAVESSSKSSEVSSEPESSVSSDVSSAVSDSESSVVSDSNSSVSTSGTSSTQATATSSKSQNQAGTTSSKSTAATPDPEPEPEPEPEPSGNAWDPPAPGAASGLSFNVAAASGTVFTKNNATLDFGNSGAGYVMVKYSSSKRLKLLVIKGGTQLQYDIVNTGSWDVIPLQLGDGSYQFRVMENTSGNSYREILSHTVSLSTGGGAYAWVNNQRVNYSYGSSSLINTSSSLAANAKSDIEIVRAIYQYVATNISYDYGLAGQVTSGALVGYIPNPTTTLSKKAGICYDYASLMSAMLRMHNIPTRLVIGWADGGYHAWVSVYISTPGQVSKEVKTGGGWTTLDPTFNTLAGSYVVENYF